MTELNVLELFSGMSCHVSAPRGTESGTQGMKDKLEKAKIPIELAEHIVNICEE